MSCEICNDNRFELIEKYKNRLIESTNIETSKDEMKVIDNILFRFWQLGWLDDLETMNKMTSFRSFENMIRDMKKYYVTDYFNEKYNTKYNIDDFTDEDIASLYTLIEIKEKHNDKLK